MFSFSSKRSGFYSGKFFTRDSLIYYFNNTISSVATILSSNTLFVSCTHNLMNYSGPPLLCVSGAVRHNPSITLESSLKLN